MKKFGESARMAKWMLQRARGHAKVKTHCLWKGSPGSEVGICILVYRAEERKPTAAKTCLPA